MNKKEWLIYIAAMAGVVLLVIVVYNFAGKLVATHEVIEPAPGIQCVVVARVFNTSVDCWRTND